MTDCPELVLLSGPPFIGKTDYYKRHYQDTHQRLCPAEIFQKDPSLGLRSVILQIVELLQQGENVVIDDENRSKESRSSYIRVVKNKVPKCKFTLIKLAAKHGIEQLFWTREFRVASLAEKSCHQKLHFVGSKRTDSQIKKWFIDEEPVKIRLEYNSLDAENWVVVDKNVVLTAETSYKLELPALFIQWEDESGDQTSLPKDLAEVCTQWYTVNPCGRVIFIADGSNIRTGVISSAQEKAQLISYLTELAKKVDFPVYAVHVENPPMVCSFLTPPSPGLIAYLQKRHSIDFINKTTVYLYSSSSHKDMAEKAGIQHLKVSKAFQNPVLVKNNFVTIKCRQPDLLRDLETRESVETALTGVRPDVQIPLWQEFDSYGLVDHQVSLDIGNGRREYLFVKDGGILTRYKEEYQENATPIGEAESKVAKLGRISKESDKTSSSHQSPSPSLKSTGRRNNRKTPSWMSSSPKLLQTQTSSGSKTIPRVSKRLSQKTMYVMTEAELVDIASRILKEAGKALTTGPSDSDHVTDNIMVLENCDQSESDMLEETTNKSNPGSPNPGPHERKDMSDSEPPVPSQSVSNVLDDLFSSSRKSTSKKRKIRCRLESDIDDESHMPDTVVLVPETIASPLPAPLSRERTTADLSVLDELFS